MTPQTSPRPTTRTTRTTTAFLLSAAVLAFVAFATPAGATPEDNITICHATESDVVNPYVEITIAPQAVIAAHIAHQHGEDIIPVFTYNEVTYSQNLDAEGIALLANGCEEPGSSSSTTTAPPSTTTASSSTTDDNNTEVPFFTSPPALALGLGGSLVATLLMLRRRL